MEAFEATWFGETSSSTGYHEIWVTNNPEKMASRKLGDRRNPYHIKQLFFYFIVFSVVKKIFVFLKYYISFVDFF